MMPSLMTRPQLINLVKGLCRERNRLRIVTASNRTLEGITANVWREVDVLLSGHYFDPKTGASSRRTGKR